MSQNSIQTLKDSAHATLELIEVLEPIMDQAHDNKKFVRVQLDDLAVIRDKVQEIIDKQTALIKDSIEEIKQKQNGK